MKGIARFGVGLCGVAAFAAGPVGAAERIALVIGNSAYPDATFEQPGLDAIDVSRSLLGVGFDVLRLQNIGADDRLPSVQGARTVALYFSGKTLGTDGETYLLPVGVAAAPEDGRATSPGLAMTDVIADFRAAGVEDVLVFVEGCHGADGTTAAYATPEVIPDVTVAFSAAPGVPCEPPGAFTEDLMAAFATPDVPVQEALSQSDGVWLSADSAAPVVFLSADDRPRGLTQSDRDMLDRLSEEDRERMLALWRSAGIIDGNGSGPAISTVQSQTIILDAPVAPIDLTGSVALAAPVLSPAAVVAPRPGQTGSGGVRIFAAPPPSTQRRALPTPAGLPQPSIIVGEIAPTEAAFNPTETLGNLAGTDIGADIEARQSLRASDPQLFEQLVSGGAFDPPEAELARVIQTELARMDCYTAGIDGIWGNGSRGAVDRYFQQVGTAPVSREPTVQLFRQTIRQDDVVCTTPRVATPAAAPRRSTPRAAAPQRNAAPAAPAPQPSQPAGRTINSGTLGTGVFR